MIIWQVDFYRYTHTLAETHESKIWELHICDESGKFRHHATCTSSEANSTWLTSQFQAALASSPATKIQVFRPQTLSLITTAATSLNMTVEATRHTRN